MESLFSGFSNPFANWKNPFAAVKRPNPADYMASYGNMGAQSMQDAMRFRTQQGRPQYTPANPNQYSVDMAQYQHDAAMQAEKQKQLAAMLELGRGNPQMGGGGGSGVGIGYSPPKGNPQQSSEPQAMGSRENPGMVLNRPRRPIDDITTRYP